MVFRRRRWCRVLLFACLLAASGRADVESNSPSLFCGPQTNSADKINVHVIMHSHVDAGWKWTLDYYESRAHEILQGVIASLPSSLVAAPESLKHPKVRAAESSLVSSFRSRRTFTWGDTFALVHFLDHVGETDLHAPRTVPIAGGLRPNPKLTFRQAVVEGLSQGHMALTGGGWVQEDEAATTLRESLLQMNFGQEELLRCLTSSPLSPKHKSPPAAASSGETEAAGSSHHRPSVARTAQDDDSDRILAEITHRLQSLPDGILPVATAWQIDSFGHSGLTARVLREMGYDSVVLNRIDATEKSSRTAEGTLEFWWQQESADINQHSDEGASRNDNTPHDGVLAHILVEHYKTPSSLSDIPQYHKTSVQNSTLHEWALAIADLARTRAKGPFRYNGGNVLLLIGDDVVLQANGAAESLFQRLDQVMAYMARDESGVFTDLCVGYSTPQTYFAAAREKLRSAVRKPSSTMMRQLQLDDDTLVRNGSFFPYVANLQNAWTGLLATRPRLKQTRRLAQSDFDASSALGILAQLQSVRQHKEKPGVHNVCSRSTLRSVRRTLASMSHHDAVTGTCSARVAEDYLELLQAARKTLQACTMAALANVSGFALANWSEIKLQNPHYPPVSWAHQQASVMGVERQVALQRHKMILQQNASDIMAALAPKNILLSASKRRSSRNLNDATVHLIGRSDILTLTAGASKPVSTPAVFDVLPCNFSADFALFNPTLPNRSEVVCVPIDFDTSAQALPECSSAVRPVHIRVVAGDNTHVRSQLVATRQRTEMCLLTGNISGWSFKTFSVSAVVVAQPKSGGQTTGLGQWPAQVRCSVANASGRKPSVVLSGHEYVSSQSTWMGSGIYLFRTLEWPALRLLLLLVMGSTGGVVLLTTALIAHDVYRVFVPAEQHHNVAHAVDTMPSPFSVIISSFDGSGSQFVTFVLSLCVAVVAADMLVGDFAPLLMCGIVGAAVLLFTSLHWHHDQEDGGAVVYEQISNVFGRRNDRQANRNPAHIITTRVVCIASLLLGIAAGDASITALESPHLSRSLLHQLLAGWSMFPGDLCSGACENVDSSIVVGGFVVAVLCGTALMWGLRGRKPKRCCGRQLSIVRAWIICVAGLFIGALLQLRCRPNEQSVPLTLAFSPWVDGDLVSILEIVGSTSASSNLGNGTHIVSAVRVFHHQDSWQENYTELITNVEALDQNVDFALRLGWGSAAGLHRGALRISDGHVFATATLDPLRPIEANYLPLLDAVSVEIDAGYRLGVVSATHAAGVTRFHSSLETRISRSLMQRDQKGLGDRDSDTEASLLGSSLFFTISACQNDECVTGHEVDLLRASVFASNPLRLYQGPVHSLLSQLISAEFLSQHSDLDVLSVDTISSRAGALVLRVVLRNIGFARQGVDFHSFLRPSSGLVVSEVLLADVNVLQKAANEGAGGRVTQIGRKVVFCPKCIGAIQLTIREDGTSKP